MIYIAELLPMFFKKKLRSVMAMEMSLGNRSRNTTVCSSVVKKSTV